MKADLASENWGEQADAKVAEGELTPSEAEQLSRVVANFARVAETAELAERIKHLEQIAEHK